MPHRHLHFSLQHCLLHQGQQLYPCVLSPSQDKEIYLLDDPLAAVDADVANHLMWKCILGVLKHKTRILCTHRTEFLEKADALLLIDNGRIVKTGTLAVFSGILLCLCASLGMA